MTPVRFVELTCGGAAVSISLLGGERPLIGWRGSKAKYAPAILDALGLAPGVGAESVHLNDAGGWGNAWKTLTRPDLADRVADTLDRWAGADQEEVWRLATASNDWATGEDAARWLVGVHHTVGVAPPRKGRPGGGFRSNANKGNSGVPTLLRPVAERVRTTARLWPANTIATKGDAQAVPVPADARGWVIYLDPPYLGTDGYQADLSRPSVLALARRWAAAGAVVGVSEAVPLLALGRGWTPVRLTASGSGAGRSVYFGATEEWVTVWRAAA
jgi:hypothetical protein